MVSNDDLKSVSNISEHNSNDCAFNKLESNSLDLDDEQNNLSSRFINLSINETEEDDSLHNLNELKILLPKVLDNLKAVDQVDTYMKFNKLVADNVFPFSNIAYLLFLDIVNWFSIDNTSQMRYSKEVKRFWRVGLKLFKGKFLRFMSGMKNSGHSHVHGNIPGLYKPSDSCVNFAVPDKLVVNKLKSPVASSSPGILTEMIDAMSESDPLQNETFKMCVDGKIINAGINGQKLGDVNLWNFEDSPSLSERALRLKDELCKVENLKETVDLLEMKDVHLLHEMFDHRKLELSHKVTDILSILSKRVCDLRIITVGKKMALEKLLNQVTGDWRSSKLAFAISAVKTKLYEIDACIVDILHTMNILGETTSVCNNADSLYCTSNQVNLGCQQNYMCLFGIHDPNMLEGEISNERLCLVKQKSEAWFSIRTLAALTGSTCYRALGFDGLKKQQSHYNVAFCNASKEEPDAEQLKRMEHGSVNEINAVSTLVSKVLPVYFPDTVFVEEGCYYLPQNDNVLFIVSPDGSLRKKNQDDSSRIGQPFMGIEIKCPYPGKLYTTPVHYNFPVYYVLQILSEMVALQVDTLLFISYSDQSSVIFVAHFDEDLWNEVWRLIVDLYGSENPSYPKHLHPNIKQLREKLKQYANEKVTLLCEVPSVKAVNCTHKEQVFISPCHNTHTDNLLVCESNLVISDLQRSVYKSEECINVSWQLCRLRANEILIFMIANLDRIHKYEIQHAIPIGYGFKGYSMKTNTMRNMIDCILEECYQRGLYTPVVSFDGQWYNIAVRDKLSKPLTILQLQKDTYLEAKQETKSGIIHKMMSANVVKESDIHGLFSRVEIRYKRDVRGNLISPITVGKMINSKVFAPSKHISELIRKELEIAKVSRGRRKEKLGEDEIATSDNVESDFIRNSLSDEVLNSLDQETIDEIKQIEATIHRSIRYHATKHDNLQGLSKLFEVECENDLVEMGDDNKVNTDGQVAESEDCIEVVTPDDPRYSLCDDDFASMLNKLNDSKDSHRWKTCLLSDFKAKFQSVESMNVSFMKRELQTCLKDVSPKLKAQYIVHSKSWPKFKIIQLFCKIMSGEKLSTNKNQNTRRQSPKSLKRLCQCVVSSLSKTVLNAIYAEHIFPERLCTWKEDNPFDDNLTISGLQSTFRWYSKPENIKSRFMYQFSLLDPHHLFTNARVKCCSSGILERGLSKNAWIKVAKDGKAGLSVALVEDLLDRQSDAFAQATFSERVEEEMNANGYKNEAQFCKLIREWYYAEDKPGISATERCQFRLNLRNWLLKNVQFNRFPPPGSHIMGCACKL